MFCALAKLSIYSVSTVHLTTHLHIKLSHEEVRSIQLMLYMFVILYRLKNAFGYGS